MSSMGNIFRDLHRQNFRCGIVGPVHMIGREEFFLHDIGKLIGNHTSGEFEFFNYFCIGEIDSAHDWFSVQIGERLDLERYPSSDRKMAKIIKTKYIQSAGKQMDFGKIFYFPFRKTNCEPRSIEHYFMKQIRRCMIDIEETIAGVEFEEYQSNFFKHNPTMEQENERIRQEKGET